VVPVGEELPTFVYKNHYSAAEGIKSNLRAAFFGKREGHSAVCFMRRLLCLVSAASHDLQRLIRQRPLEATSLRPKTRRIQTFTFLIGSSRSPASPSGWIGSTTALARWSGSRRRGRAVHFVAHSGSA